MNDNFDLKFLKQVQEEFPEKYRNCLDSCANPEPVTDKEITDAVNCALLVEEFYQNNKDLNKPTYVAFMDVKSAFDVVVHENLMRKLYHNCVGGLNWLLINSLHQESLTSVKWQGQLSESYVNERGIRQGGVLSTDLFKVYDSGLQDKVQESGRGAKIGKIGIEASACAGDTTYLSNDAESLKFLINISKDSSDMNGYILQEIKRVQRI